MLDANILVRAVPGKRVREFIAQYGMEVTFFVPKLGFEEAEPHLSIIAAKRDRDFFGAGVATWTSANIEIYLRGD